MRVLEAAPSLPSNTHTANCLGYGLAGNRATLVIMRAEDVDALLEAPLRQLDPKRDGPLPRVYPAASGDYCDYKADGTAMMTMVGGSRSKEAEHKYSKEYSKSSKSARRDECREFGDGDRRRDREGVRDRHEHGHDYDHADERKRQRRRDGEYHEHGRRSRSRSRGPRGRRDGHHEHYDHRYRRSDEHSRSERRRSYSRSPTRTAEEPTGTKVVASQPAATPIQSTIPADKRTVFVRQIGQRVGEREVREVCERAGRVVSVRMVIDRITRRHKGVAYVEYAELESLSKALALTGTRLANIPLIFEMSDADKNRIAAEAAEQQRKHKAAAVSDESTKQFTRVIIEQLHPSSSESDVRSFLAGYGPIQTVIISRSRELAQIDFKFTADAKRAVASLDRQVLLARQVHLKLTSTDQHVISIAENDVDDRHGPSKQRHLDETEDDFLTPEKRAELMLKLARNQSSDSSILTIANLATDEDSKEIEDEIRSECCKHGKVLSVKILLPDRAEVHFGSTAEARSAQQALDSRWFSGRQIHVRLNKKQ